MRQKDIDKLKEVIVSTGVATFTQRVAICTRLQDWFDQVKDQGRHKHTTITQEDGK